MKKFISIVLLLTVLISITACGESSNEQNTCGEETETISLSTAEPVQVMVPIIDKKIVIDYTEIEKIQIEHPILSKSGITTYYNYGNSITIRKAESIKKICDFFGDTPVEHATARDIQVGGANDVYLVKLSFSDNTYADLKLQDGLIIGYFADENGNPFNYEVDNQDIDSPLKNTWRFSSFNRFSEMFSFK